MWVLAFATLSCRVPVNIFCMHMHSNGQDIENRQVSTYQNPLKIQVIDVLRLTFLYIK